MMKQKLKLLCSLFLFCFLLISGKAIYAASASVAFSSNSETYAVGDTFVVTLTAESSAGISGFQTYVAYDPDVLELIDTGNHVEGNDGLVLIQDLGGTKQIREYHMKFKACKVASTEVYVSDTVYMYSTDTSEQMSVSQNTLPLTIEQPVQTQVQENKGLASLSVSEGTLSPVFDPSVLSYNLEVPNEVTKVFMEAKPKLKAYKVKIKGNENLKEGQNVATVSVTDATGQQKIYTININRMSSQQEELQQEEEPEEEKIEQKNTGKKETKVSVYKQGSTMHLYSSSDLEIVPIPDVDLIPNGFTQKVISVAGKDIIAYTTDQSADYVLVYGKIGDSASKFYVYDQVGQCLQRYDENYTFYDTIQQENVKDGGIQSGVYLAIIIVLVIILLILLFLLIVRRNPLEDYGEDEDL